jgi:hypothetical protein
MGSDSSLLHGVLTLLKICLLASHRLARCKAHRSSLAWTDTVPHQASVVAWHSAGGGSRLLICGVAYNLVLCIYPRLGWRLVASPTTTMGTRV